MPLVTLKLRICQMYPIPRKKLEGPQVFMLKLSVNETIRHWPCGKRMKPFLIAIMD